MPVDRPTFSESWYRVAALKPRLRASVQTYRQYYRGRMWYVVQDPSNNQFFRLSNPSYFFIALLDGKRTVAEAWDISNEHLGDHAPTQGEAIRLLGQLYTANLLQAELPADALGMFERYRKRVRRELSGYLINILFPRVPLVDPDRFLDAFEPVVGWIFSWVGFLLWAALIGTGFAYLAGHWAELFSSKDNILLRDTHDGLTERAVLLYLTFAVIKAIHELGHAFACKHFGKKNNSGGEVHTIGLMLLVFMPAPYVDASAAWTFRSRWQRAIVGAAGMYVELAVAAIAAIVWTKTPDGSILHAICYNAMFVASVSTVIFNGNPLLRYDGYYILSDLLEIPNLAQRAKEHLYFLVKKYVYGVRQAQSPGHSFGEKFWLFVYAIASSIYRVFVSMAIIFYVADKLFIVGALMAIASVVTWLCVPFGKFIHYLLTSEELVRTRGRAVLATLLFALLIGYLLGFVPMPDRDRAPGVVDWDPQTIRLGADGFVQSVAPSGTAVDGTAAPVALITARNDPLSASYVTLVKQYEMLQTKLHMGEQKDPAQAASLARQIDSIERQLRVLREQIAGLGPTATIRGTWISPDAEFLKGVYVHRGDEVGQVNSEHVLIRAFAAQDLGPRLESEARTEVDIQIEGRADETFHGKIVSIRPASENLPTAALGYPAGGSIGVEPNDPHGLRASESLIEVRIAPDAESLKKIHGSDIQLYHHQRVWVRFRMIKDTPKVVQWYRYLRQVLQQRFGW